MNFRTLAFCTAWCAFAVCAVRAQDPFDDLDAPPGNAGNLDAGKEPSLENSETDVRERDAVVLSLRANPPKGPLELARAIQLMTRIRRWEEVGRWLDEMARLPLDPNTALAIVERAGSKTFLDLSANANLLSDNQRQLVERIQTAAAQSLRDPKSLTQRVQQLQSPSKGERLSGFDALQASGNAGIAAVINAVLAEGGVTPQSSMIEAYSLLGDNAVRAWQAAMTTPHEDARQRLVELVARAPKPNMGCELLGALHDPTISQAAKDTVALSLANRRHAVPTAGQVHRFALLQIDRSLDAYQRHLAMEEVDTETLWQLSPDGRSIAEESAIPAHLHLARASQAAQVALRLVPESDLASATAMASHWEFLARRGAVDATNDPVFQTILPESLRDSHEFACLIWDAALSKQLAGAQALAISNLSRWEGVTIPLPVRERLVAATKSGHPQVRFPAAVALMKSMMPSAGIPEGTTIPGPAAVKGFEGSSRMDLVAREMQQMTAEPAVLMIGGSPSLRSHTMGLLNQFGYRIFEASSVADVFSYLRTSLPIEQVFIVDHVRDLDLGQLIQRIRANPSTSRTPIALLADSLSRGEHAVADADRHLVMASVPPSTEGLGDILQRMMLLADRPNLDTELRILYKYSADNYFRTLRPSQPQALSRDSLSAMASTPEEQHELLRVIDDVEVPVLKREQASQIFVQSVRRFGLLITSEAANAQYDVYNERGEDEPVTRAVVGRILDAIEAANGNRSWSELAP
jgi:hypothetical protein